VSALFLCRTDGKRAAVAGQRAEWRGWIKGKPLPNDPEAAFVGFYRKRQRRMAGG
jgi:hypothetical protein